jgi:ABC-type uncharacterized transport system substrate-binding protein
MLRSALRGVAFVLVCLAGAGLVHGTAHAAACKVLVVMSYERDFPWVQEIEAGVDSVLSGRCDVHYFYMNTKSSFSGAKQKAAEAFELYRKLAPDGVIAADDDAQAMFVVPYLKDKVATPVMFCGVNADPAEYGYPASNVSGVLERLHIQESIALARQLVPSIRTIAFMMKESPVARLVFEQIRREGDGYPVKIVGVRSPKTLQEAVAMATELRRTSDALFLETLEGIPGSDGRPLKDKEVMPVLAAAFGKSTIGSNAYAVHFGLLSAVVKTGAEQGETAGRMLLKAIDGTPVSQLPVTRNHKGKRMINVSALKALGVKPRPVELRGAELVRTSVP